METPTHLPLVSIITPFLNVRSFLPETIESVLAQEYKNWELLLIDDGSADGSTEIAKEYALRFPGKIRYFEHPGHQNRGAAASRNVGLKNAAGEYIAFLDSDDLYLPSKLYVQVDYLTHHPEVTVICEATKYWYSWSDSGKNDEIIYVGAAPDTVYTPPQLARILYPLAKGRSFCTCGLMVRASSLAKIGGFDESFTGTNQLFEDQVLFLKILLNETVFLSTSCNNIYRQRSESLMHGIRAKGHYHSAKFFFLVWLEEYVKKQNIKDVVIRKLLRKALFKYRFPVLYKIYKRGKKLRRRIIN